MDADLFAPDFSPRRLWPDRPPTDLIELPGLAARARVGRVFVKLESRRPLGNFKSLGGVVAGLRALARHAGIGSVDGLRRLRDGLPPLLCASEGNHGLAVAAAARFAGARAVVHLRRGVSAARTARIRALGAEVVPVDGSYDDAVRIAREAAAAGAGLLTPDTSEDPDDVVVADVMDGYALIARELAAQFRDLGHDGPTHAFVQAGVGGLAAGIARGIGASWPRPARLLTVEPAGAACVAAALESGRPRQLRGDLRSGASMLSCGLASAPAVRILLGCGARGVVVDEAGLAASPRALRDAGGPPTTISGAAGLAGLLQASADPASRARHGLDGASSVLLLATEGVRPDDPAAAEGR